MKKIYLFTLAVLCLAGGAFSQNYYWVGGSGAGAEWSNSANWSNTSGGAGGFGVPNLTTVNAIFDQPSRVLVDITEIDLGSLSVINSARAVFYVDSLAQITLHSTSGNALTIAAGATKMDSTTLETEGLHTIFSNNTFGLVDGTWGFDGFEENFDDFATFFVPTVGGRSNRVDINGRLYFGPNSKMPLFSSASANYVFFNDAALLDINVDGDNIMRAIYHPNSTVLIRGNRGIGTTVSNNPPTIGHLVINLPNLATAVALSLGNMVVQGDMSILNTNGYELTIMGTIISPDAAVTVTLDVLGDLNISGNSNVVIGSQTHTNKRFVWNILGDANIGGVGFNVEKNLSNKMGTSSSTSLRVLGNLNHTSGFFHASSQYSNNSTDHYIVEMAGTIPQTIFSHSGNFNNTQNNSLTLLINNPSGVTLLSPLAVGRLSFASVNKGILTTSTASLLTIMNNSGVASSRAVTGEADNGYVDGPVRRRTTSTGNFRFPTGKGGNLRVVNIVPSASTENFYQVEYFNTGFADNSRIAPIQGISSAEYWEVQRVGPANPAVLGISLKGQVPGAGINHGVFIARYDGADWVRADSTFLPGNSSSGLLISDELPTLGYITLAYANLGALPIELLSFTGRKLSGNAAQLNWKVTAESTPERFEVLRSANGRDFRPLGSLSGKLGLENYQFVDEQLPNGTSYYRLKMIDIDGTESFSKVIAVMNGGNGVLLTSMLPTVVLNQASVNVSSAKRLSMQFIVTDQAGRIVHRQMESVFQGSQEIRLNLQSLAKGVYQLTGYYEGQRTSSIRFVRQ